MNARLKNYGIYTPWSLYSTLRKKQIMFLWMKLGNSQVRRNKPDLERQIAHVKSRFKKRKTWKKKRETGTDRREQGTGERIERGI